MAFLSLSPFIANLKLSFFAFCLGESFSRRRSNFKIASLEYLFRMSKFLSSGSLAALPCLAPRPAGPAACIEKFHNSDEADNATTMAAKIHSGVLFIIKVSPSLVEGGNDL